MYDGQRRYSEFRNERFIEQTKKISDVIHKVKLPSLNADKTSKPDVKTKIQDGCTLKDNAVAQRNIDIAKAKGEDLADISKYDICSTNMLFEGELMAAVGKSDLLKPLEESLGREDIIKQIQSILIMKKLVLLSTLCLLCDNFRNIQI